MKDRAKTFEGGAMTTWKNPAFRAMGIASVIIIVTACDFTSSEINSGCFPHCQNRQCGDDGCGGSCGVCSQTVPFCSDGVCSSECVSDPACTQPDVSVCVDDKSFRTCDEITDGCYFLGEVQQCDNGLTCFDGKCLSSAYTCGEHPPIVNGALKNNITNIDFTGEEVEVHLFHKLDIDEWEDGCVSKFLLVFSKSGLGCKLNLQIGTFADGSMGATGALFTADSFCPGWSDADEGEYVLAPSFITLCSTVEVVEYMTESTCIPDVSITFGGFLKLVRKTDNKELDLDLSGLIVNGDMVSVGNTDLVCPDYCAGKECGDDGYGGSCGDCPQGQQCNESQTCIDPCKDKECGDDGYGGSCGDCALGDTCSEEVCMATLWTDPVSGLTWRVAPPSITVDWESAKLHCETLTISALSDWHLPTIDELRTLVRGCPPTEPGGACPVDEDSCLVWSCKGEECEGCPSGSGPASGCYWPTEFLGQCDYAYWSSSPVEDSDVYAWVVLFQEGAMGGRGISKKGYAKCVR